MKKKTNNKIVNYQCRFPEELHRALKLAAKADHRTILGFIITAIEERIAKIFETNIESSSFLPEGLQRDRAKSREE